MVQFPAGVTDKYLISRASFSSCALHSAFYASVQGDLYLEMKLPGREADRLPPTSAEDKDHCSYNATLSHAFIMPCSWNISVKVKRRDTCEMYGRQERCDGPEKCPQCERCDRK